MLCFSRVVLAGSVLLLTSLRATADGVTHAGTAAVIGVTSAWIAVESPLTGDDNRNGWTHFEIATDVAGPFGDAPADWSRLPGPGEWRTCVFARGQLTPSTDYYVRVTYLDPDGVVGANPQVLGPITTPASSPEAVTVGIATAEARLDEILVSVPIAGDADADSGGVVEIATDAAGPWARKCGNPGLAELPFHPKRCRLRSLTPGTDYWVRVTIHDGDGISGTNPQVLGPIVFSGLENLALGQTISADPGWGCCPSPAQLVDGRIQDDDWPFGFAWTGGTAGWGGGPAGIKQATVDLGTPTPFNRAVVWYHNAGNVPTDWSFQWSDDGTVWHDAVSLSEPICRGASTPLPGYWSFPACSHEASFAQVTARYFRYRFDDTTLFGGIHGWVQEIEIFNTLPDSDLFVTTTADSGPGSLRQAILDANADPGTLDVVVFAIPTADPGFDGGVFTLQPLSALPAIHHNVVLDATSQTSLTGDTNPLGPEIVLDGSLAGSGTGLLISGDGSTVKGLVIHGFSGAGLAAARLPFDSTPSGNQLLDNYIGTDATGTVAVPNDAGISIGGFGSPSAQARDNVVSGNLISGNSGGGLSLCDAADTQITDNLIGTDRTGTAALGNGDNGILFTCAGSPRNQVTGNTIAWNAGDGFQDLPDYRFSVAFTADGHQGNSLRGNSIFGNGGLGINLLPPPFPPTELPSTPTPNDSCDVDAGGNLLQNFPVLTGALTDGVNTTIDGFLDGNPDEVFEIELFANAAGDPSGFGQGEIWLDTVVVETDGTCLGDFNVVLPVALPAGTVVTATATDAARNTSEFSAGFAVTCLDSDGDGVCDDEDLCPDFDDALDADGDGVPDGCDVCAGSDDGADADSDGVPDGCDVCPGSDDGLDADADGVPDGCDQCQGDDGTGDADEDQVCSDLDCDDGDPAAAAVDNCGICGGDDSTCGIFSDGFESGDTAVWSP